MEFSDAVFGAQKARPNRSARARRAQYSRAEARRVQALLRNFRALQHRGCQATKLRLALSQVLVAAAEEEEAETQKAPSAEETAEKGAATEEEEEAEEKENQEAEKPAAEEVGGAQAFSSTGAKGHVSA